MLESGFDAAYSDLRVSGRQDQKSCNGNQAASKEGPFRELQIATIFKNGFHWVPVQQVCGIACLAHSGERILEGFRQDPAFIFAGS